MDKQIDFIVNGERLVERQVPRRRIVCRTGAAVELPLLAKHHAEAWRESRTADLSSLRLSDIVAFLYNVGQNWKSREYARRRVYIQDLVAYLGYSQKMAEWEANWIAMLLSSQAAMYDAVAIELGDRHILDAWIKREESEVRAFPKGQTLHVCAGNVPMSCVVSIVRALLTKNTCVIKASSDDLFTPYALAGSLMDVDSSSPLARALTVVHWSRDDDSEEPAKWAAQADVICAWGADEAMTWAHTHRQGETDLLAFGPKRSLALICPDVPWDDAAEKLAFSICAYDQRACFSTQQVFVVGDSEGFIQALGQALERLGRFFPKGVHRFDEIASHAIAQREAVFLGHDMVSSQQPAEWTIVRTPAGRVPRHPLGRFIYVHAIDRPQDVLPHLNADVQTLGVHPWSSALSIRDAAGHAGVSRIVELGMNNIFRVGGAHDGRYPMQRLVRYVSNEMPSEVYPKQVAIEINQYRFAEENRFVEFIP
jgi:long-chain-fatty-acyl-CoA reductase